MKQNCDMWRSLVRIHVPLKDKLKGSETSNALWYCPSYYLTRSQVPAMMPIINFPSYGRQQKSRAQATSELQFWLEHFNPFMKTAHYFGELLILGRWIFNVNLQTILLKSPARTVNKKWQEFCIFTAAIKMSFSALDQIRLRRICSESRIRRFLHER